MPGCFKKIDSAADTMKGHFLFGGKFKTEIILFTYVIRVI